MITLSNAEATEMLDYVTESVDYFDCLNDTLFAKMCELLALLSGEENHQSLMLTPVDPIEDETDETFDFTADEALFAHESVCPTGNCPVLMPPQLEQMG
jgi:hypothetical protein